MIFPLFSEKELKGIVILTIINMDFSYIVKVIVNSKFVDSFFGDFLMLFYLLSSM